MAQQDELVGMLSELCRTGLEPFLRQVAKALNEGEQTVATSAPEPKQWQARVPVPIPVTVRTDSVDVRSADASRRTSVRNRNRRTA